MMNKRVKRRILVMFLILTIGINAAIPAGVFASLADEKATQNEAINTSELVPKADGVIEIASAEQLKELAISVNNGTSDFNGKTVRLTNDIDLSGNAENPWIPIGVYTSATDIKSFKGIFEGNGKTVSGIYINSTASYQGLFTYNSGIIQNLTVAGSISGAGKIGGIAGYNAGEITGCKNQVSIQATASAAGGITGYSTSETRISNCANYGMVNSKLSSGSANYVGGIVGQTMASVPVLDCYNAGTIRGNKGYVGGIVGYLLGTAQNCYNKGFVLTDSVATTGKTFGGIAGGITGAGNIDNSYNSGIISAVTTEDYLTEFSGTGGSGAIIGSGTVIKITNSYYLEGSSVYGIKSVSATTGKVTADTLASAEFIAAMGDSYKSDFKDQINNGYPLLSWQTQAIDPVDSNTLPKTKNASYAVTFMNGTASYGAQQTVGSGQKALKPAVDPHKNNYTFKYWSISENGAEYDFSQPVNNALTLYAVWEETITPDKVLVTFKVGDTTYSTAAIDVNEKAIKPDKDPSQSGYDFSYWSLIKDGEEYNFESPVKEAIILYAVFNKVPYEYEIIENESAIKITKYIGTDETAVTIPDKIKNLPVTVIGNQAFMGNETIMNVKIPDSVTLIEDGKKSVLGITGTFAYCRNLSKIVLTQKITKIPDCMFYGAGASQSSMEIEIPDGVQTIGASAFSCCNTIVSLKLPSSVTHIGESAFYQSRRLANLTIPGVVNIEADAFTETIWEENYEKDWQNNGYQGVAYAGNVAYMYFGTHAENKNMPLDESIKIADGTTGLSPFLFNNHFVNNNTCKTNLKSITLPSSIKYIPKGIFDGFNQDFVIKGLSGTYAETYAKENNLTFYNLNQSEDTTKCTYEWFDKPAGENLYLINSVSDLRGFEDIMNIGEANFKGATVKLGCDIDLQGIAENGYGIEKNAWTPLGQEKCRFEGIFDGGGHTIKGIYINGAAQNNQGFFDYVGSNVTVKNLNFANSAVYGNDYVGGLIGQVTSESPGFIVESCSFDGEIIGYGKNGYVGGLIGDGFKVNMTNCSTTGKVKSMATSESTAMLGMTGGIIGYGRGSTITACTNKANIASKAYNTGGIVGSNLMGMVSKCANEGQVEGYKFTGGIVGKNGGNGTVSECKNAGTVLNTANYAGGIAGCSIGAIGYLDNCENTGIVTGTYGIGGILGYSEGSLVTNSVSKGNITGQTHVGGITGYDAGRGAQLCWNDGKINATTSYGGGVIGYCVDNVVLKNCYNKGSVEGAAYIGGIAGYVYKGAKVYDCYNQGEVAANDFLGGIAGFTDNGCEYKNCYNIGKIEASEQSEKKDALFGSMNANNTITNCYFITDPVGCNNKNAIELKKEQFNNGEASLLLGDAYGQLIGEDQYPQIRNTKNEVVNYTVSFKDGSEMLDEQKAIGNKDAYYEVNITKTLGNKEDKVFVGWKYEDKVYKKGIVKVNGNAIFMAVWEDATGGEPGVDPADQLAAKIVVEQIMALPSADKLALIDKADVIAARNAYKTLTDAQKALVNNLATLEAAEKLIAVLETPTPMPNPSPTPTPEPGTAKDDATGIEVIGLPKGVGLKVEPETGDTGKTDEAEKAAVAAGIKDAKIISLYSIKPDMSETDLAKFNSDPESFVTLTMPLGDDQQGYDNYTIYHKKTDGTVEWITPTLSADGKSLIFKVNAFSEFGVVGTKAATEIPTVDFSYRTHVQDEGWQDWKNNGAMSGTQGQSLRLEGIEIKRTDTTDVDLGIRYETHIENLGWEDSWKIGGKMSGTEGQSLRLEAIRIELTGADAKNYDVYYQVHAQNTGWMGWAKNGEDAGTAGFGYRLEGIHVIVVPKGQAAPGSTDQPFVSKN